MEPQTDTSWEETSFYPLLSNLSQTSCRLQTGLNHLASVPSPGGDCWDERRHVQACAFCGRAA